MYTRDFSQKVIPYIIAVFGGIFLLVILGKSFTIIQAGERGVVMKLGKVQDQVLDEGFHLITPFVTNVKKINVRVQKTEMKSSVGTKDLQSLNAEVTLNWHIEPSQVNKIYQTIGDNQQIVDTIINPAITESVKATTPKRTAEEILKQRAQLKTEIEQNVQKKLVQYGLKVDDVSLTNMGFSEEFKKAIEQKQIAEQQALQADYITLKAKKEAEAEVNRAKGLAESQKLLRQTLTPELLQKQAIDKWDGHFPEVMGGSNALPFINIELNKPPKS